MRFLVPGTEDEARHRADVLARAAHVPAPAPGILAPDCPVTVRNRPAITRLRELARTGRTVLLGDEAAPPSPTWPAELPVAVHRMRDLDPGPTLREALGAHPDEAWVLPPDAHVAAVATAPAELAPAVARAVARTVRVPARTVS